MYEIDVDLTQQRRSFRYGQAVYSIVLESVWWRTLEDVCPSQETRKGWIAEWIEDARVKGCNRQALIRFRIHQMALEDAQDRGPDPRRELLQRIGRLREKRLSWARIATLLSEVELLPGGEWSGKDVKAFYDKATAHVG